MFPESSAASDVALAELSTVSVVHTQVCALVLAGTINATSRTKTPINIFGAIEFCLLSDPNIFSLLALRLLPTKLFLSLYPTASLRLADFHSVARLTQ